MDVWYQRFHNPHLQLPGETFPRGGYKGVPDGYVYEWPHATSWPNIPKKKGKAWRGVEGGAGIKSYMTKKLFEVELWQAIAKLVVTCDLPFKIVEAEAFRELLILCNHHCGQKNFIPSRWTIARDTVVFAATALQAAIAELLVKEGELGCKVSYSIDMWTAPNGKAWLVVTDDGASYTGKEMTLVVEETVVQRGLQGCCLGLTSDNASSNIAAFRRLSEEGGG
ncbi:unnamed protein product [Closterium sp. NIES-53]